MRIQSSNITEAGLGCDARQLTPDDSNVDIPSVIAPTFNIIRTHVFAVADSAQKNSSVLNRLQQSRTNQAALTTGMFNLAPGLWEISIVMASEFNFLATIGTFVGVGVELFLSPAAAIPLLRRIASIGNFVDVTNQRLLLNITPAQLGRIQVTTDVTGAGQSTDVDVTVNACRVL